MTDFQETGRRGGLMNKGTANPMSKLCPDDVREIRRSLADGESSTQIADRYMVSATVVRSIRSGKTWSHVT